MTSPSWINQQNCQEPLMGQPICLVKKVLLFDVMVGSISADLLWSAGSFPEQRLVIEPNVLAKTFN